MQPLPREWIEQIFATMIVVYGRDFTDRWAGVAPDALKGDWAKRLAGLAEHPKAIAFALRNLPADRPPNVLQFRALCFRAPRALPPALPEPQYTPEQRAARVAHLKALRVRVSGASNRH